MIVAHVGGAPVEETLAPVVSGVVVGLLLTRTWIASRVRLSRRERTLRTKRVIEHSPSAIRR